MNESLKSFVKSLNHPSPNKCFSLADILVLIALSFFSYFIHTFHIAFPRSRVFDEVHFGSFTNYYLMHKYFHDIHPPLGKLILAFSSYLAGYQADINFQSKNSTYPNLYYFTLRQTSSSFSSLLGPVGFCSMKFFGFSTLSSFMVGIFLATETMMIVEGRLILIDAFLHAFSLLTILAVSILSSHQSSIFSVIFVSLMCGCTFSVKYTGLSILVFVGSHQFLYYSKSRLMYLFKMTNFKGCKDYLVVLYNMPFMKMVIQMLFICFISISFMLFLFSYHISILKYHSHYDSFLPIEIRKNLVYPEDKNITRFTSPPSLFHRVLSLISIMHSGNMKIRSNHSAASKWYKWPLVQFRSLVYFSKNYALLLFPTPLIWYPSGISPLICLFLAVCGYFLSNYKLTKLAIWSAGYYASWIPFVFIRRAVFIYHYLIPLIFGIFSFGALLDILLSSYKKARAFIFALLIVGAIGQYIFFMPLCSAMKNVDWNTRKWYKNMF